jgi:hypothetical protein
VSSIEWHSPPLSRERSVTAGNLAVVVIILLLFVAAAAFSAARKDVTRGFDEVAHLSYVAEMQRGGWPALEKLRMLDPQTFRFTAKANYLNHPPFYYALLAALGPRLENHPGAVLFYRFLNILIAALGLAAAMAIGLVAGFDRLRLYAYCVPLACIPVLAPLAGAVNPDNAAFAGGAVALLAGWQLVATRRTAWLLAALAGVFVASWAKLTGLLLSGGFLAAVFLYLIWRGEFRRVWIFPIALAAALAVVPYAIFMAQYGSPTPNTPAQIALLESGSRLTGWAEAPRLSFPAYAIHFLAAFVAGWMPTLMPRSALNYLALAIPLAALLCAFAGLGLSLRRLARRREITPDIIIVAGFLTLAVTFAGNIVFSYGRHLATGWMMDAYPRYYLPLAAIVPLAGLSLAAAVTPPRWRAALIVFFIVGPLIFRLIGAPLGS